MRSKVTLPWNAAAWRQSTYEPRVRKVHDPIGDHPQMFVGLARFPDCGAHEHACKGCGYHVCSCERQACYTLSGIGYTKLYARKWQHFAELYARKYGEGVPVPAEPTLCDAPVQPNPGPAGPCCAMNADNWHCDCDPCGFCKVPASAPEHDCSRRTGPHRGLTP